MLPVAFAALAGVGTRYGPADDVTTQGLSAEDAVLEAEVRGAKGKPVRQRKLRRWQQQVQRRGPGGALEAGCSSSRRRDGDSSVGDASRSTGSDGRVTTAAPTTTQPAGPQSRLSPGPAKPCNGFNGHKGTSEARSPQPLLRAEGRESGGTGIAAGGPCGDVRLAAPTRHEAGHAATGSDTTASLESSPGKAAGACVDTAAGDIEAAPAGSDTEGSEGGTSGSDSDSDELKVGTGSIGERSPSSASSCSGGASQPDSLKDSSGGSSVGRGSAGDRSRSSDGFSSCPSQPASACSAPATTGLTVARPSPGYRPSKAARAAARKQRKAARAARKLERVRAAVERARIADSLGSGQAHRGSGGGGGCGLGLRRSKAKGSATSVGGGPSSARGHGQPFARAAGGRRGRRCGTSVSGLSLGDLDPGMGAGGSPWGTRSSGGDSGSFGGAEDAGSDGFPADPFGGEGPGPGAGDASAGSQPVAGGAALSGALSTVPAIDGRTSRSLRKKALRRARALNGSSNGQVDPRDPRQWKKQLAAGRARQAELDHAAASKRSGLAEAARALAKSRAVALRGGGECGAVGAGGKFSPWDPVAGGMGVGASDSFSGDVSAASAAAGRSSGGGR